jgi:integrase
MRGCTTHGRDHDLTGGATERIGHPGVGDCGDADQLPMRALLGEQYPYQILGVPPRAYYDYGRAGLGAGQQSAPELGNHPAAVGRRVGLGHVFHYVVNDEQPVGAVAGQTGQQAGCQQPTTVPVEGPLPCTGLIGRQAQAEQVTVFGDELAPQVVALVSEHPEGVTAADVVAALPGGDVHSALSALSATGRVTRLSRGVYAPAEPETATNEKRGLSPQTVRSTLTTFGAVVQSYMDQGVLPRNVIALVERPKDADPDDAAPLAENSPGTEPTAKSWTLAEVLQFRDVVRGHRLYACWLLSCYGLRRSEVLGLRWNAVDLDTGTLSVRRGRVAVGGQAVEDAPKSRRSRRDLPLPADVTEALRALRHRQQTEAIELGRGWSDDRLVALHEDGTPLRPESYTDEFQRLRTRAGLSRIKLHGLRNTSVTLMLDQGHPPHIVAGWRGHDPAVALSIYSDVKADELRVVGASLFG